MRVYRAKQLVSISNEFVNLFAVILKLDDQEELPSDAQAEMLDALRTISQEVEVLGLPLTKISADRFANSLPNSTGAQAEQAFDDLNYRFQDEIYQIRFFYVKPEKMDYFGLSAAFGADVAKNFPSAEYDIQEAANCYALGRYTATVMHSMRALEAGLVHCIIDFRSELC